MPLTARPRHPTTIALQAGEDDDHHLGDLPGVSSRADRMRARAFVAMPFGTRDVSSLEPGGPSFDVDFDELYELP